MAKKATPLKAAADCCDVVDPTKWPVVPYCDRNNSRRWGAILFCGDVVDEESRFGKTLEVIYQAITRTLHVDCGNIRVLYNGPHTSTVYGVHGIGTAEELYKCIRHADQNYDVLFLVMLGHGAAKEEGNVEEPGLVCAIECDAKARPIELTGRCKHLVNLEESRSDKILPETRLCADVLSPRELSAQLSVLSNCLAHVSMHCCNSGLFAEVARSHMVSSFTSATGRIGATVECDTKPYWQAPLLWAHRLAVNSKLRPLRSAMAKTHADLILCDASRDAMFV